MKKIIITLSTFALVMSVALIPTNASDSKYMYNDDPFEIKNIEAKEKLSTYLKQKNKKRSNSKSDNIELDTEELNINDISDFDRVIQVADGNSDFEYLYTYQDENVKDVIAYDKTDSAYILLEQDLVNDTATFTIDNETFLISGDDSDLSLVSDNGSELTFYEEVIDDDYPTPLTPAEGQEVKNVDGDSPTTYATSWKKLGGPMHKTSKMTFKVLEILGVVGSAVSLFVDGILGTVVFIYSVAVSVGSTLKPTVHIKYYQYGASDCLSYIKEQKYYYGAYSEISKTWYEQIKTKSGSAKVTYSYFHSQRPDYTGNSACLKY